MERREAHPTNPRFAKRPLDELDIAEYNPYRIKVKALIVVPALVVIPAKAGTQ
jgi:hypothetical protein